MESILPTQHPLFLSIALADCLIRPTFRGDVGCSASGLASVVELQIILLSIVRRAHTGIDGKIEKDGDVLYAKGWQIIATSLFNE